MGAVPSPTPHVRDDATSSTASSRTYRLHRSGRAREGVAPGGKVHTCNNNDNTTPKSNTANQPSHNLPSSFRFSFVLVQNTDTVELRVAYTGARLSRQQSSPIVAFSSRSGWVRHIGMRICCARGDTSECGFVAPWADFCNRGTGWPISTQRQDFRQLWSFGGNRGGARYTRRCLF